MLLSMHRLKPHSLHLPFTRLVKLRQGLLSLAVLLPVLIQLAQPQVSSVAYAAPNGLPSHFGLGLAAGFGSGGIDGWMPESGIPWDYSYQYLAGGAGKGWSTWNDKGQFPLYYAKAAASHHYIPVLTYYQLLYSDGPCAGCDERQKDLAHLNDPSTMRTYLSDFALLMKRLGSGTFDGVAGFGSTAIVHVEPDLSGYAELAAQQNDPSTVPAAVASSGMPEVAAYPNTFQGFNWALLHLRDLYAPNVRLAFHVSPWGSGTDIGSSHDAGINADALGRQVGSFAAASGVASASNSSTYDLLFTDVLDRDAGFYKYVQGDPNRWWDRLNITYPNFARWEQFISATVHTSGKQAIVWQIPMGNQYFQSEDNSKGHYQDNRAEYFFGHLDELRDSGVIGLLFGGGAGGQTTYNDSDGDGITNPAPICTTDGLSSGQICNDHPSSVPDDDGGFLRMSAKTYYSNPLPVGDASTPPQPQVSAPPVANPSLEVDLGGSSIDPPVASPGQNVDVIQNGIPSANGTVLVQFDLYNADGQPVVVTNVPDQPVQLGFVAPLNGVLTLPDDLDPGRYTLKVGVYSNDGNKRYAWNDSAGTLTVVPSAP
jgi:hypothetical protein